MSIYFLSDLGWGYTSVKESQSVSQYVFSSHEVGADEFEEMSLSRDFYYLVYVKFGL